MPLRCVDLQGKSIHSFDLTDGEWETLYAENRKCALLTMPCCDAKVVLRKSRRGTQFFAHKAIGSCATAPEREEHLRLKAAVVVAARSSGWTAETEVTGATPNGAAWRADVLARRGRHSVAIEIQWSGQSNDETIRRQMRYRESGIRGLWLLRRPGFPISHDLPAAIVSGDPEIGFTACIPSGEGQAMPIEDFLAAAFNGRFRFGLPIGARAVVDIHGGLAKCWHDRCQADTTIISHIDVRFGQRRCSFDVSELGEHPHLLSNVVANLPDDLGVGTIKPRYSNTQRRSYYSNGCSRCDRLFGEFMIGSSLRDKQLLCSIPICITDDWHTAITAHHSYEEGWGVYAERPTSAADA